MPEPRVTIRTLQEKKQRGEKIVMLTAYDYPFARLAEQAGVDALLVGDSLAMVVLGHETTLSVTVDEMLHHTRAVARATRRALLIADMPFLSYQVNEDEATRNAGRFLKEGGAHAIKIEGGAPVVGLTHRLSRAGIPVVGHIGMTPQSVHELGGYRVQGKDPAAAQRLLDDALALQDAGAGLLVLELIPAELAARITRALKIPTIGIGAGPHCDGQVQVLHDMLGLFDWFAPRHAKRYAQMGAEVERAIAAYVREVSAGEFPAGEHSFSAPALAETPERK
ncbi:MAG: 3-methyl-2-oxobutanoate hydroxymethyltransferase [Armatimonadetes bacterium]|nr:3-methyl-2-oxobutanoate hydroxymethyltransferase [Armatimonadota bacterium]